MAPTQATLCQRLVIFVSAVAKIWPKLDFTGSRLICEVNNILQSNSHPTHECTCDCEVSLRIYGQFFRYGRAIIERKVARGKKERKKEKERKNIGETLDPG